MSRTTRMPGHCVNSPRRDTDRLELPMLSQRTCSLPDCNLHHYARGYCRVHYQRQRTHGTVDLMSRIYIVTPEHRARIGAALKGRKPSAATLDAVRAANTGRSPCAATLAAVTTHGMTGTPVYQCWRSMKERCLNPKSQAYANYGGRGITICERWRSFENFYADMAPRPTGLSIDRIDNDGNYEPGNCRWATAKEQAHNRRQRRV